jgi:2-dehydro-3-deoxy-D-gluconate 5-dehydrogenase
VEDLVMGTLNDKVALVTGGGSGLGRGMALALARAGAIVVIVDINAEKGASTARDICKDGRRSLFVDADIAKKADAARMVRLAVEAYGSLDIAINSAGVPGTRLPSAELIEEKDARRLFDIMLFGTFFCCQEEAKQMIRQKGGRIINIASISGCIVNKGMVGTAPYNALKAGIIHMSRGLAMDWDKHNIMVNTISPGYMLTPATEDVLAIPERHDTYLAQIPMSRFGVPEDLAGAVLFLSSALSGYVTGQNVVVDGGVTVW